MATTASHYADLLAPFLAVTDQDTLRAAAAELDTAIAGGTSPLVGQAKAEFQTRLDEMRQRLVDRLLDAVPLEELKRQAAALGPRNPSGMRLDATLGPLYVSATLPTVRLTDPRDGSPLFLGPTPPTASSPASTQARCAAAVRWYDVTTVSADCSTPTSA